jgi:hypothetical protein
MPKVEKSETKKTSGPKRTIVYDRTDINKETEIGILDVLKLIKQERDKYPEILKKREIERIERLKSQEGKKVVEETEEQIKEREKRDMEFIESLAQSRLEEKEARKHKMVCMDNAYWEKKSEAISSDKEKLIWLFRTIKKIKERNHIKNGPVYVGYSEIIVKPFFILEDFVLEFNSLFEYINSDKDFFRKHNMSNYKPRFEISIFFGRESRHIEFYDFTDDFIKAYMRDKLGIKTNIKEPPKQQCITLKSGKVIEHVTELTWLLYLLLEKREGVYTDGIITAVKITKIQESPFSYFNDTDEYGLAESLYFLLEPLEKNEEFRKKHNMENCHPKFAWNEYSINGCGLAFFEDYTDDFLKAYLKMEEQTYITYIKNNVVINNEQTIKKIEVLKSKTEKGRIEIYINGDCENDPLNFARNKKWGSMYELAKNQRVPFNKNFYDYFNYQRIHFTQRMDLKRLPS